MEIVTLIQYYWNRYLVHDTYSDEQLRHLKKIGCEGIENERPYDYAIVMGGVLCTIVIGIFLMIAPVDSFFSVMCNTIFMVLVALYLCVIGPLLEKDNERMGKNSERIKREGRRLDLIIRRDDEYR